MKCPLCGKFSSPDAETCVCGYRFKLATPSDYPIEIRSGRGADVMGGIGRGLVFVAVIAGLVAVFGDVIRIFLFAAACVGVLAGFILIAAGAIRSAIWQLK